MKFKKINTLHIIANENQMITRVRFSQHFIIQKQSTNTVLITFKRSDSGWTTIDVNRIARCSAVRLLGVLSSRPP